VHGWHRLHGFVNDAGRAACGESTASISDAAQARSDKSSAVFMKFFGFGITLAFYFTVRRIGLRAAAYLTDFL